MEIETLSISVASIVIVTALALVALIGIARWGRRMRERQTSEWVPADGEVLEVWQDGTGSYCVRYRFSPQGVGRTITREEIAGCLKATLPAVGERVPVRYDPDAPMRARMQHERC